MRRAIIGVGALALLLRPGQIEVRLARQQIEPMAECFLVAADEGVNVVGRQVAIANEQPENLDVALRRIDGDGAAVAADHRVA